MADVTTRLALPFPEGDDPANIQADIEALAEAIDDVVLSTVTVPHTWAFTGEIDPTVVLPVMFVPVPAGQTAKLVSCRYKSTSGSGTFDVEVNGSPATGFGGLSCASTAATTNPTDVVLSNNDEIAPIFTALSTLVDPTITVFIEYGVA